MNSRKTMICLYDNYIKIDHYFKKKLILRNYGRINKLIN